MESDAFKYVIYPGNNHLAIQEALNARNVWQNIPADKIMSANLIWKNLNFSTKIYSDFEELLKYDRGRQILLNHFQYNHVITTKSGLLKSLKYYYSHQLYNQKRHVFESLPTTFIINAHKQTPELRDWKDRFQQLQDKNFSKQKMPQNHCEKNVWFIKPESENQGRGIILSNSMKQLQIFLNSKPINSNWIVQKAIQKPFLYQGRKFDIRVWALVTGNFQIYYYKIPYMRTSSHLYSLQTFSSDIHLTNNSLQKTKQEYSKFEKGNTLPLSFFREEIMKIQKYKDSADSIIEQVNARMKQLVLDSFLSARKLFYRNSKKKEFQLFGFDFLVDQDFRVWLLQVNNNPYIGTPNDFIKQILPKMVNQMFQIVLDPIFPPKNYNPVAEKNFQLIYRQSIGSKTVSNRGFSSDRRKNSMYPVQFEKQSSNTVNRRPRRNSQSVNTGQNSLYLGKVKYSTPVETIKSLLENYCFSDYEPFFVPVNYVLTAPKLQEKQSSQINQKNLKLITQTRISGILVQTKFLQICKEIIDSEKYDQKIKAIILQGYFNAIRNNRQKLLFLKKIGPSLGNLILKMQTKNIQLQQNTNVIIIKLLIKLGGYIERKIFIPGQTRDAQQVRQTFIRSNMLGLLMHLKQKYPVLCQQDVQNFLSNLNQKDWDSYFQMQKKVKCEGIIKFAEYSDPMSTSTRLQLYGETQEKMRNSLKNIFDAKPLTNRLSKQPPLPRINKIKHQQ